MNVLPVYENINWQWDEEDAAGSVVQAEDGSRFVFARIADGEMVELQRLRSTATPVWTQRIATLRANAAVLLYHDGKLYAALYSNIATGCRILALDATSGDVLWDTPLKGLGPLHHSKYSNLVQMRFINDWLVVFGKESGGKYIEVLDPKSGQQLFNQVVQSKKIKPDKNEA
jgi:outer membrane protein assembly factor BamB